MPALEEKKGGRTVTPVTSGIEPDGSHVVPPAMTPSAPPPMLGNMFGQGGMGGWPGMPMASMAQANANFSFPYGMPGFTNISPIHVNVVVNNDGKKKEEDEKKTK